MSRLWSLALALLSTVAAVAIGSTPANAFGSETIGCSVGGSLYGSPNCSGLNSGGILYDVRNLSGTPDTYSFSWTVYAPGSGTPLSACATQWAVDCLSGPCTSITCSVRASLTTIKRPYTAYLVLSQNGQSRTLTSSAFVQRSSGGGGGCPDPNGCA